MATEQTATSYTDADYGKYGVLVEPIKNNGAVEGVKVVTKDSGRYVVDFRNYLDHFEYPSDKELMNKMLKGYQDATKDHDGAALLIESALYAKEKSDINPNIPAIHTTTIMSGMETSLKVNFAGNERTPLQNVISSHTEFIEASRIFERRLEQERNHNANPFQKHASLDVKVTDPLIAFAEGHTLNPSSIATGNLGAQLTSAEHLAGIANNTKLQEQFRSKLDPDHPLLAVLDKLPQPETNLQMHEKQHGLG